MNRIRNLWLACIPLLLSACMLVQDFGTSWEKGENDVCLNRIVEALYYTEFRRDPSGLDVYTISRSFTLGDKHFLMLKQNAGDKGGRLYRFAVKQGIFQRFRLDPVMKKTFLHDYPNAPVSLKNDTVTLTSLTPEVLQLLAEISDKPEYWEIEEQTLYNTLRSPACRYEDRDLKALDASEKAKKQKP